jgi:hypothetical protein
VRSLFSGGFSSRVLQGQHCIREQYRADQHRGEAAIGVENDGTALSIRFNAGSGRRDLPRLSEGIPVRYRVQRREPKVGRIARRLGGAHEVAGHPAARFSGALARCRGIVGCDKQIPRGRQRLAERDRIMAGFARELLHGRSPGAAILGAGEPRAISKVNRRRLRWPVRAKCCGAVTILRPWTYQLRRSPPAIPLARREARRTPARARSCWRRARRCRR